MLVIYSSIHRKDILASEREPPSSGVLHSVPDVKQDGENNPRLQCRRFIFVPGLNLNQSNCSLQEHPECLVARRALQRPLKSNVCRCGTGVTHFSVRVQMQRSPVCFLCGLMNHHAPRSVKGIHSCCTFCTRLSHTLTTHSRLLLN